MPSGHAVGRGKPHLRERLFDCSHLGLVYLASTKSLQTFPVSGGGEVSTGLAQDGLGHVTAGWKGPKSPPSPQSAPSLLEGTRPWRCPDGFVPLVPRMSPSSADRGGSPWAGCLWFTDSWQLPWSCMPPFPDKRAGWWKCWWGGSRLPCHKALAGPKHRSDSWCSCGDFTTSVSLRMASFEREEGAIVFPDNSPWRSLQLVQQEMLICFLPWHRDVFPLLTAWHLCWQLCAGQAVVVAVGCP